MVSFWENLEYKARDLLFMFRGNLPVGNEVVIVNIGDNTFSSLNRQWPFPREYYAKLIENLEEAGAKQIVFDIEFTEKSNPQSDKILAETAAKFDNVIFAGKLIREIENNFVKQQLLPPIKEITKRGLKWGTVNISNDNDGFVRRYELFQKRGNKEQYSIGVVSVASLLHPSEWKEGIKNSFRNFRIWEKNVPKVSGKSCLLNYFGPPRTFPYFDFADVLDDSTFQLPFLDLNRFEEFKKSGVFKDKIVLVGIDAIEFHDTHNTPYFAVNNQLMPGVEIHANFIQMVLSEQFLKNFSEIKFFFIFIVITFFLFVINYKIKPSISIFFNVALIIANFMVAYHLFAYQRIFIPVLQLPVLIIVCYITGLIFQYIKAAQERKFIKSAFQQYISPELVNVLLKDPKKLEYGGEEKEISVLFSDIRSFTPYTESHNPKETVSILQEYLTAMVEVILRNRGTLDKFVGDAIVALFGTPVELDNHAYWACKAAFEMKQKLRELQRKWEKEHRDPFENGIGINSGTATVGNLGSEQIFDYTAIGDTINAGARLESLNKQYSTKNNIIISEATYEMAKDRIIVKFIDEVKVKGKTKTIKIYELLGMKEEIEENTKRTN